MREPSKMCFLPSVDLQLVSGHFFFFFLLLLIKCVSKKTNGKVYSASILNPFNKKQNNLMWATQDILIPFFWTFDR